MNDLKQLKQLKHTPGPWSLTDLDPIELWTPKGYGKLVDISYPDATLIAAAPEMLEVLEHLVQMIESDVMPNLTAAQALIAKATGAKS